LCSSSGLEPITSWLFNITTVIVVAVIAYKNFHALYASFTSPREGEIVWHMKKGVLWTEEISKSLRPAPPDCFIWGLMSLNMDNAKINVVTVLCWLCGLARFGEKKEITSMNESMGWLLDWLKALAVLHPGWFSGREGNVIKTFLSNREGFNMISGPSCYHVAPCSEVGWVQPASRSAKATTHLMDQAVSHLSLLEMACLEYS